MEYKNKVKKFMILTIIKKPTVSQICNIHFNKLAKAQHTKVKMSQYSFSM